MTRAARVSGVGVVVLGIDGLLLKSGRRNIERQHPLSIKMSSTTFKSNSRGWTLNTWISFIAGPFHLGNPVGDFGYGHRR